MESVEKIVKLNTDESSFRNDMQMLADVKNKQIEVEKVLEEGKQNQLKLSMNLNDCFIKFDQLNSKTETLSRALEKTRSTVAKKLKKMTIKMENYNENSPKTENGKESANELLDEILNKNELKLKEMDDKMIALEMARKKMCEQLESMNQSIQQNTNQISKMKLEIEGLKQMALNKSEALNESEISMKNELLKIKTEMQEFLDPRFQTPKLSNNSENRSSKEQTRDLLTLEVKNRLIKLEQSISYAKPPIRRFCLYDYHTFPDYTWTIRNLQSSEGSEYQSKAFALLDYPFSAFAKLYFNSDQVLISVGFQNFSNAELTFAIESLPKIYFVLKDQTGSQDTSWTLICNYDKNAAFEYEKFYYKVQVPTSKFLSLKDQVDDSIVLDIHSEPPSVSQQVFSYDGTLTWSIENYYKHESLWNRGLQWPHESPYFYTSARGYKVQALLYFDTQENVIENYSLIVEIVFLPGNFDAELPKSFQYKIRVIIFDSNDLDTYVIKKMVGTLNKDKLYKINMGNRKEINKFVSNNTLFYKVTIKTLEFDYLTQRKPNYNGPRIMVPATQLLNSPE